MKKVFLTIACVAFAFAANAQLTLGGNLGFGIQNIGKASVETPTPTGITTNTVDPQKTFNFAIQPKIGYAFNDKMAAGIIFGIGITNTTNSFSSVFPGGATNGKMNEFSWNVTPYFRYNIASFDRFTFFGEASVFLGGANTKYKCDVANGTWESEPITAFGLKIAVTPGLNYKINQHISMDLYLDLVNLGFAMDKTTVKTKVGNDVLKSVNTDTEFGLGINSLTTTLNGNKSVFRVGFNYTF